MLSLRRPCSPTNSGWESTQYECIWRSEIEKEEKIDCAFPLGKQRLACLFENKRQHHPRFSLIRNFRPLCTSHVNMHAYLRKTFYWFRALTHMFLTYSCFEEIVLLRNYLIPILLHLCICCMFISHPSRRCSQQTAHHDRSPVGVRTRHD